MTDKGVILVVDDTPVIRELLFEILSEEGYRVHAAENGELALASVTAGPPELILMDIRIPGMDGFEVLRQLKAHQDSRDIPIILISGNTEMPERVEGLKLGAVDFITKPFQREELLARVHNHMELMRLRVHIEERAAELITANNKLREALANVRTLSGMLPICACCKQIRDDRGYWTQVETFVSEHSEAVFTSGLCPDCEKKAYEDLEKLIENGNG